MVSRPKCWFLVNGLTHRFSIPRQRHRSDPLPFDSKLQLLARSRNLLPPDGQQRDSGLLHVFRGHHSQLGSNGDPIPRPQHHIWDASHTVDPARSCHRPIGARTDTQSLKKPRKASGSRRDNREQAAGKGGGSPEHPAERVYLDLGAAWVQCLYRQDRSCTRWSVFLCFS